jgi:hypothetical protein
MQKYIYLITTKDVHLVYINQNIYVPTLLFKN